IRSYGNIFNTHIYPDSVPSHRQGENIDLTGHADKIAPTRVFAHRHPLGSALDKARPFKLKLAQFRQLQPLTFSVEVLGYVTLVQLIADRLALVAFLKTWVLRSLIKEVFKRFIQINQLLGMTTACGLTQPRVFSFLNFGELSAKPNVIGPLFSLFIRLAPCLQRPIPNKAGMAKFNGQLPFLLS